MNGYTTFTTFALAVAMIAALILLIGGIMLMKARATRKRGVLMIVCAAVLVMNVMIWTV